ncbi:hypothetical protein M0811_06994 [Anaeramoeba ignava]|uniref:Uncharacterized protein n=1 Tax=Anaeramoeba ignava TaxID=1746090 RepID=A0A9Q0LMA6_ANAIG|nr:hypothetical protein M0811_06994 [Anaeramoeba ignava]
MNIKSITDKEDSPPENDIKMEEITINSNYEEEKTNNFQTKSNRKNDKDNLSRMKLFGLIPFEPIFHNSYFSINQFGSMKGKLSNSDLGKLFK